MDCPRRGGLFLFFFGGMGALLAILAGLADPPNFLAILVGLIFAGFGAAAAWHAGPNQLHLSRTNGLATVSRHKPLGTKTETYPLAEVDDVMSGRCLDSGGHGLAFELASGTVVKVTDPNHHNPEAQTVGREIRQWLKAAGYR
ncbi:hypothetical protein roselon_01709 [Roseibacterium elongatum DSM 19469]|uniref:Uncharacterized protein n=1 Tax=Roseicyclus elongatus DSM 19469 TaxID=1294273 RepID=W8RSI5_9RHOB|nr:hypothetical protein roselon_01709 [Roseibacterium elongatum DSM 19469]